MSSLDSLVVTTCQDCGFSSCTCDGGRGLFGRSKKRYRWWIRDDLVDQTSDSDDSDTPSEPDDDYVLPTTPTNASSVPPLTPTNMSHVPSRPTSLIRISRPSSTGVLTARLMTTTEHVSPQILERDVLNQILQQRGGEVPLEVRNEHEEHFSPSTPRLDETV